MTVATSGLRVDLSLIERRLSRAVGEARYAGARKAGIADQQIGRQTSAQTDLDGAGGEIAFGRLANVYPLLTIGEIDRGFDCWLGGYSVDVKVARKESGNLVASYHLTRVPDLYVLMVGTFPSYEFRGWTWKEALLQPENVVELIRRVKTPEGIEEKRRKVYSLPQTKLLPIEELLGAEWRRV
jgi:hypothetical protein